MLPLRALVSRGSRPGRTEHVAGFVHVVGRHDGRVLFRHRRARQIESHDRVHVVGRRGDVGDGDPDPAALVGHHVAHRLRPDRAGQHRAIEVQVRQNTARVGGGFGRLRRQIGCVVVRCLVRLPDHQHVDRCARGQDEQQEPHNGSPALPKRPRRRSGLGHELELRRQSTGLGSWCLRDGRRQPGCQQRACRRGWLVEFDLGLRCHRSLSTTPGRGLRSSGAAAMPGAAKAVGARTINPWRSVATGGPAPRRQRIGTRRCSGPVRLAAVLRGRAGRPARRRGASAAACPALRFPLSTPR